LSENPVNSRRSDTKGGPVENWDRIIHKNVRAADGQGFGKVIAVPNNEDSIIISSQGGSDQYRLDKTAVSGFNGAEVMLDVTSSEMRSYLVQDARTKEVQPSDLVMDEASENQEGTIPLVEERLNVTKRARREEATIRKESVKESKTIEVPVTHDELIIERRPASGSAAAKPTETGEELRISLNKEEVEVTKEPFVKEELVIRKEPRTETKTVTETVRSERLAGSDLPLDKSQKH
jgi:uncharacterized protein (TIGR02271 family)